ncbi:MAG: endonuclease/exonuclease/phosphatase family protein [Alphaproteobacteria bacterium]|nr:endonuclease/exonuclease/phosphatase family protein [Alphaproteobacteria bacterium]
MTHIRILSYNIHGGRSLDGTRDVRRIHAVMERLDIDIAIFQEMETRPSNRGSLKDEELLAGEDRPHRLRGKTLEEKDGWYGNFLVSRFPIRQGLVHNLETHEDLEPRNALDAIIDTPLGAMRFIGTHLSLSYLERFWEARNLLRLMQEVEQETTAPLFLLGDINEWQPHSKLIRHLNSAMIALPCKATFPAFAPIFKLDRVWHDTPKDFQVSAHRMSGRGFRTLSDHLPLVIEIRSAQR